MQQGNIAKAIQLERQLFNGLRSVEGFGQEAREEFIDAPRSELVTTVIETGDAWTKWAATIRSQPQVGASYRAAKARAAAQ